MSFHQDETVFGLRRRRRRRRRRDCLLFGDEKKKKKKKKERETCLDFHRVALTWSDSSLGNVSRGLSHAGAVVERTTKTT